MSMRNEWASLSDATSTALPATFASPRHAPPLVGSCVGPWIATRGSRSRSLALTARGIDPICSSSSENCTSVPLIRGDPSLRSVAIVRCLREDISLRTRLAKSGCAVSNSAHEAMPLSRRWRRRQTRPRRQLTASNPNVQADPSTRTLKSRMGEPGPAAASPENAVAANLFEDLPPRYDRLTEVLSLGQSGRWRRELVRHLARFKPRRILDVATGTAGVAIALANATDADIVGIDISEPMLERGRKHVYDAGLDQRIRLQHARVEQIPFPAASFDAVTFTYLLRYVADPMATLAELTRVLRPSGGMASLDFYVPPGAMWRAGWRMYTRALMPSAGYLLGGHPWWNAGRFLGPNLDGFHRRWPVYRLFEAWREAGMVDVEDRVMSLGGGLLMWGRKHHA